MHFEKIKINNMRYHGFATRDYLIMQNITLGKEKSLLEIGVGVGSTIELIIGKVKEIYGIDISRELIEALKLVYQNNNCVKMQCLDVCEENDFDKKFDVIYSADTLEHVKMANAFFDFIAKHLFTDGVSVVTFPNESKQKHHGITWFGCRDELLTLVDNAGLKIVELCEVKPTVWHVIIRRWLWDLPKSLVSRGNKKKLPQTFDQTEAFQIFKNTANIKTLFFAYYAKVITKIAVLLPLYEYRDVGEKINNKILLMRLKLK
ncbi:MAG: class I SAM-dependent methyltransferase [Candidatus Paceibacterota bacterium]